ncbi:MAG: glycosyltransferase [Chloroflexi bacterium]|nr:glycosyltransferase [Chloroflexota bacterium]
MSNSSLQNETIILFANAEWDWETRINCHHLAARLAQKNRVLFLDTIGGRTPAPREWKKILRRLRRIAGGVRQISESLTVVAPFVIPIYGNELIRHINTALVAAQIRRALPRGTRPILWIFLPALVGMVGRFQEKLVIYHCVDEHAANPNVPANQVRAWEKQLLARADLVFTTSNTLYEAKRAANPNTFYLPNVAGTELFARVDLPMPDDLQSIPRPIAGYIGNISAYKMDLDLLAAVARRKPDWSFVLIGPIGRGDPATEISNLQSLPNLYLLGARAYAELPRYVHAFDACLIPNQLNESTRGSLPMKFFEYLAAGKPVIATDLPTLAEFRDYYYPIHDAAEFSAALDAARSERAERAAARIALAQKYSWSARMIEIEKIVLAALARKPKHLGV